MSNDLFGNLGFGGGKGGGFPGFPGGFGAGKDGGNGRGGSGGAGGNGNRPLPKIKFKKPGPLGIAIGVIVALVVLLLVASAVWTEVLWFRQTGYLVISFHYYPPSPWYFLRDSGLDCPIPGNRDGC